jgi:hypothetical protein
LNSARNARVLTWWLALSVVIGIGTAFAACDQGEGETCQIKSDCEGGLVCCISPNTARGSCLAVEECEKQMSQIKPDSEADAGD